MNEHVKQRLVGAVVLVSLAVIFIPMLLDSGEGGGMPLFGSNIPDKPDYKFEPLDIPLEPVKPIEGDKPLLVEEPQPTPKAKPSAEKEKQSAPAKPQEKPLVVKSEPVMEPKKPVRESAAWVVQVGSFSNSANALKLRDKLRSRGFTAFVEKLGEGDNIVYRVRVGPELEREMAESLRDKLQKQMQLKGIVMGYSS